jgi:predicted transposase YdaD
MRMKKSFDATMRKLLEVDPAAWLRFLHVPLSNPDGVRVIDSNVSTITAEADKVLWVDEQEPWIEHVELQAGRDIELSDRVHHYNTSLGRSHQVPVHTTIILLRPAADGPDVNGTYERRYRNGDVYDWFRYDVVRIWQQPVEEVLASGLPVLPLAPVANVEPEQVPKVLLAISERLVRETSPEQAATFWAATKVMMGLRYPKEQVEEFERGVSAMILGVRGIEESSVYQDIFAKGEAKGEAKGKAEGEAKGKAEGEAKGKAEGEAKGKAEGEAKGRLESARLAVLRLGRKKFGPPAEDVRAAIDAINDVDQLGSLLDRVLDVSSWHELLTTTAPSS